MSRTCPVCRAAELGERRQRTAIAEYVRRLSNTAEIRGAELHLLQPAE